MARYPYRTEPFEHQREALRQTAPRAYAALFMEMGTGKTKVIIDTAAWLYLKGEIDALLVVAPNTVHVEWVRDQIPTHMPPEADPSCLAWASSRASTKTFEQEFRDLTGHEGLAVLTMNIEAVTTQKGKAALRSFLKARECLFVVDESTDMKTPSAKRTKTLYHLSKRAKYRRILSGLPDPEGPMDLFAQLRFLSPKTGVGTSFAAFKNQYGRWESHRYGNKTVPVLTGFRNIDQLQEIIGDVAFQATKDEALDLPPKLYTKRYFDLSREQQRLYDDLRDYFIAELEGEEVTAALAVVRLLRLHQISCGYVPVDPGVMTCGVDPVEKTVDVNDPGRMREIPGPNPRLAALERTLDETGGPVIVWCRFRNDVDLIMDSVGDEGVRFDGSLSDAEKSEALDRYKGGEARILVANPAAAGGKGRGLNLQNTRTVIYYSQYFSLEMRVQSEDRAHRAGTEHPVLYIDLIGAETVDERIVHALREKKEIAHEILGRPVKEWI